MPDSRSLQPSQSRQMHRLKSRSATPPTPCQPPPSATHPTNRLRGQTPKSPAGTDPNALHRQMRLRGQTPCAWTPCACGDRPGTALRTRNPPRAFRVTFLAPTPSPHGSNPGNHLHLFSCTARGGTRGGDRPHRDGFLVLLAQGRVTPPGFRKRVDRPHASVSVLPVPLQSVHEPQQEEPHPNPFGSADGPRRTGVSGHGRA